MALRLSSLRSAARRLRSLHFVPGGSQKKALASRADALIIDLEDSVLPAEKASAREEVSKWMTSTDWGSKTVCEKPHMLVVPKVSSPADLDKLGTKLAELEKQLGREVGGTTVLPIVSEVPEAPLRAHEIARHPRVEAVTPTSKYDKSKGENLLSAHHLRPGAQDSSLEKDLSAELGAKKRRDGSGQYLEVFQLCRSLTLLAAKGAKVQAIDTVYTNLKDLEGLRAESETSADTGFDGKLTIHPDQIDVVNAAFSPSSQEVAEATELLEAAKSQPGAFRFKGQMVDIPHFKQAQRILDRADSTGPAAETTQKPPAWPEGPFHGKWLEELTEGLIIPHALTRTVSETDNLLFTTMTLNPARLHLDYESAKATQFGKPLVNSMFTLALLVGMSVLETTHGTTIANLGFEEVVFPKPVFYGDTLRAETEVIKNRPSSSNPSRGIVTFEHRAFNQNGQVVCKARRNAMMRKRPSSL
eukprot:s741_g17.t1